jgi:hypothetical protein
VFVGEVARELRSLFANVGESGSKMQATPFVHPPERVLSDTEAPQDQKQFPCLYSSHPQGGTKRKIKVTYDHQLFSSELNQSSKTPLCVCVTSLVYKIKGRNPDTLSTVVKIGCNFTCTPCGI